MAGAQIVLLFCPTSTVRSRKTRSVKLTSQKMLETKRSTPARLYCRCQTSRAPLRLGTSFLSHRNDWHPFATGVYARNIWKTKSITIMRFAKQLFQNLSVITNIRTETKMRGISSALIFLSDHNNYTVINYK